MLNAQSKICSMRADMRRWGHIPSTYTNTIPSVTGVVEKKSGKCLNNGGERGI